MSWCDKNGPCITGCDEETLVPLVHSSSAICAVSAGCVNSDRAASFASKFIQQATDDDDHRDAIHFTAPVVSLRVSRPLLVASSSEVVHE